MATNALDAADLALKGSVPNWARCTQYKISKSKFAISMTERFSTTKPELRLWLSEEIPSPYNRPFPFHRLVLRGTQRIFPFGARVVLINSDGVGNPKVAVGWAMEADCISGTGKLLRRGFADWAKEVV